MRWGRKGQWVLFEKFVVTDEESGSPYLVRWRLFECPWFRIFLHHILRSDKDRHLHDHPWSFVSLVLWGGYLEHRSVCIGQFGDRRITDTATEWRPPLSVAFRSAEDSHRVELERPAWTLLIAGPRRREWGFWTENGWVQWQEYLRTKEREGAR